MGATVAQGSSVTISSFTADLIAINGLNITRDPIDTTALSSTGKAKTFTPDDVYDPGELDLEFQYAGEDPPHDGSAEDITINVGSTSLSYASSGHLTNFSVTAEQGDKIRATGTWKLSGPFTVTTG